MQALIAGIVAAFVGIVLGFWLRAASAKTEKAQLEKRAEDLAAEVTGVRAELGKAQEESAKRAGFESLAVERLEALSERSKQLEGVNQQLEEKNREILRFTAANSKLVTDLDNERGNGERLSDQFKVLANEILKDN